MGRINRSWVSQLSGSFHIISRTVGGLILFQDEEKEYFMKLLEHFAAGFFVQIHAFCIMGNHFHILATGMELDARNASEKELLHRYRSIYGKMADPPVGSYEPNGTLIPDADGGIERLRLRLGSISRFVQEVKQTFSHWYNKKHNRKGYLWSDRFKGIIVSKGEAQLACSAYIELNPLRANLVSIPDDYRWCSLGLFVRNPKRAKGFLYPINQIAFNKHSLQLNWYRKFVYLCGGIAVEGKNTIKKEIIEEVVHLHGRLGIGNHFRFRVKNISEGIAIGTHSFIKTIQEKLKRKFIYPRSFLKDGSLYTTRVLRL